MEFLAITFWRVESKIFWGKGAGEIRQQRDEVTDPNVLLPYKEHSSIRMTRTEVMNLQGRGSGDHFA